MTLAECIRAYQSGETVELQLPTTDGIPTQGITTRIVDIIVHAGHAEVFVDVANHRCLAVDPEQLRSI